MIVLAIDPGFERLGWSVGQILPSNQVNLLSYGLITTSKTKRLSHRYQQICQQINQLLDEFHPHEVAIESLFIFKNQKTVMQVAEVRGMLLGIFLQQKLRVWQYSPPQIKAAVTGFGRADKKGVEKLIRLQFSLDKSKKIIDDTIDALAILLTHAASRGLSEFI